MPLIKSDSKQAISKNIATEIEAGKPRRQAVAIALNIARHLRDGGSVEPSEAQKSAGNYKKAHISIHGLDISVENPRGTHRRGVNPHTGHKWAVQMPGHYGYIKRTEGADGDHVDCTVGPDVHSDTVFVIDQNDIDTGKFDEHKCMIGYASEADALRAYRSSFSDGKGSDRIGHVRRMNVSQFKKWLVSDKTKEPLRRADGGRVNETLDDYTADFAVPRNDLDSIGGWDLGQPGDLGQGQKLIDETKDWKRPSPPGLDIPAEPPADWQPMGMLERAGRRLTGTMPGEERHQLWPEKMIRSAVTAPGDYLTGTENAPPPGLRREDYTDVPGAQEPADKMIERAQDLAGLVMGGGLPAAEKGAIGAAGGKLTRNGLSDSFSDIEAARMRRDVTNENSRTAGRPSEPQEPRRTMTVHQVPTVEEAMRSGNPIEVSDPQKLSIQRTRTFGDDAKDVFVVHEPDVERGYGSRVVTAFFSKSEAENFIKNARGQEQSPPSDFSGHKLRSGAGDEGTGPVPLGRSEPPTRILADGTQAWYQNDKLHREDGPASISPDGTQKWYQKGKLHREDGPAVVWFNNVQSWYKHGQLHREDGPAVIDPDGAQSWYKNGQFHREDGPADILPDGTQKWYHKDVLHREDGPAVIKPDGTQFWYQNDKLHREDGPAIVRANGVQEWYWKGRLHRKDGPALIWPEGLQEWYRNGQYHREDGPAVIEPDGTQLWYRKGKLHREDGPAVILPDGTGRWYFNGEPYTPSGKMGADVGVGFSSAVDDTVAKMPTARMTGEQWLSTLKNKPGVKADELEWSGLEEFLKKNDNTKLSQKEVSDFLAANKLELNETRLSGSSTRYQNYATLGTENYRELLFIMPSNKMHDDIFLHNHWPNNQNVIAHTRVGDIAMYNEAGQPKRTLLVDEIQSDWHQRGRDEGYRPTEHPLSEQEKTRLEELYKKRDARQLTEADLNELVDLTHRVNSVRWFVPDAPFKKTWSELVLKRMMSEAAAKDYDRLAWTSGETQSKRYRLSRFFDELEARQSDNPDVVTLFMSKNGERLTNEPTVVPFKELPQYVGAELAEKIASIKPGDSRKFSGLELQTHAPGMIEFYDKIVPRAVEKLGKPWGLKAIRVEPPTVQEVQAAIKKASAPSLTELERVILDSLRESDGRGYKNWSSREKELVREKFPELYQLLTRPTSPYWYVDIPKKMREDLAKKGFPLFQRGVPAAAADDRDRKANGGMIDRTARIARRIRASGTTGPLVSAIGGRTDHLPLEVPQDSYVLPADHVSALGQGNTLNGFAVLNKMFGLPAASMPKPRRAKFASGGGVPVLTAGGEFIVSPEKVAEIGNGDPQRGHEILDKWVISTRKKHISTLKSLPGPERS